MFWGLRTTKAQTSMHILISAFDIPLLESTISKLVSIFYLLSVDEQAGFNLTLSETRKIYILASRPILLNGGHHVFR